MQKEDYDFYEQKVERIRIGDSESPVFVCGKNENCELGFKDVKFIDIPNGIKGIRDIDIKEISSG